MPQLFPVVVLGIGNGWRESNDPAYAFRVTPELVIQTGGAQVTSHLLKPFEEV